LPLRHLSPTPLFLDHASTTPVRPEVEAVMVTAGREGFANPSSQHAAGRRARQILEDSRERILEALGGSTAGPSRDRLVFTSGATEANRLAILGMGRAAAGAVATSARDHSGLRAAATSLAKQPGWSHGELPLTRAGTLDPVGLAAWLHRTTSAPTRILCTTLVCGQTGTCEPWPPPAAGQECRPADLVHADATQAVVTEVIDFQALGIATLTLAPHKFGGPRGIGALLIRRDTMIDAVQSGPQEMGLRGGTEAVVLAAGFAAALDMALAERAALAGRLSGLRDRFEQRVLEAARSRGIAAVVIGEPVRRAAHISTLSFPGHDRQALAMAADLAGLCCATGTACASGSSEPAPALVASGLPADIVRGAVRFSFGSTTTADDLDRATAILATVLGRS
jgi:cysteine desulfurase